MHEIVSSPHRARAPPSLTLVLLLLMNPSNREKNPILMYYELILF